MIKALTIINTIAIIGFILLQIAIFRSGKPKMDHLTQWMKKQEDLNKKLINEREEKQMTTVNNPIKQCADYKKRQRQERR